MKRKKIEKKLALTNNDKNSKINNYDYNIDSSDKEKFKKFSKLVSIVESKGDLVLAHKLKIILSSFLLKIMKKLNHVN